MLLRFRVGFEFELFLGNEFKVSGKPLEGSLPTRLHL